MIIIILICNGYTLPPRRGTKLWEQTAIARTIGMPNNRGMRRQPPTGEVGGTNLLSPLLLPLNSVDLAKKPAKSKQFYTRAAMFLSTSMYAARIL